MKFVVYSLLYFLDIVVCIEMLKVLCETKLKRCIYILAGYAVLCPVIYLMLLRYGKVPLLVISGYVYVFMIAVLNKKRSGDTKNIFYSIIMVLCIELIVNQIYNMAGVNDIIEKVQNGQISNGIIKILDDITIILILAGVYVIRKKRTEKTAKNGWMYAAIIATAISLALVSTGLDYAEGYVGNESFKKAVNIILVISYISMTGMFAVIKRVEKMKNKMSELLKNEIELKEQREIYYKTLLEKETETKRYRHDMNYQLLKILSMSEKSENEELKKYVENLYGEMQEIRTMAYELGNDTANVLINHYIGQVKDIAEIKVSGMWCGGECVNQNDLCSIIGNIMKNAVRAITEDENTDKYLDVELSEDSEELKMIVKNSCRMEKIDTVADMLPQTTKDDGQSHGIGLKSVKDKVEKNNGVFKWKCENGCFWSMFVIKK